MSLLLPLRFPLVSVVSMDDSVNKLPVLLEELFQKQAPGLVQSGFRSVKQTRNTALLFYKPCERNYILTINNFVVSLHLKDSS